MADVRLEDFDLPEILPNPLPVLALRRGVLLPGAVMPLKVGRAASLGALDAAESGYILVVAQRSSSATMSPGDLLPSGVIARIVHRKSQPNRPDEVLVQGLARAELTGFPQTRPFLTATFTRRTDTWPSSPEATALLASLREELDATIDVMGLPAAVRSLTKRFDEPSLLVDLIASNLDAPSEWKRSILRTPSPVARAEAVLTKLIEVREIASAQKTIRDRMQEETKDFQREAILRQQLKAIQSELGESEEDEVAELRARLDALELPDDVRPVVQRELRRLERLNPASPERSGSVDWLEWVADLPWSSESAVDVDLDALEAALERSHHGLDDVKQQVLEHLSVRKLSGSGRADVLLLVGPPGVGKTSIGQAIADATGRKLVRIALGGVRDEAELRGHRRTYVGSRPGRLIEGMRRAGTRDAVVLLDEVDKLGESNMGSPAAALLEVLDPEQNHAFVDRYMEVPFDLSQALFIATANDLGRIPAPLRDRMEILEIAGYSSEEKRIIAREHLLTRLAENAGISQDTVHLTDAAIDDAIRGWTREAGVRSLQRVLGKIYRAAAVQVARGTLEGVLHVDAEDLPQYLGRRKIRPSEHDLDGRSGVATGLAWSPVGGSVLYVETSTLPGKGSVILTGQLGDVMRESARAALTYALANAEELGIDSTALEGRDLHVHFPAGAIPKDGPSAGVTIFTALVSLLTDRPVRDDVAMTGEATLRGRVLPVGGIKAKVLAAHRQGLRTVILPRGNGADVEDIPETVRAELTIHLVDDMSQVLQLALEPSASPSREAA